MRLLILGGSRFVGPWDAVIDVSAYVPRNTLAVAHALRDAADHYLLISTLSVYADWPLRPLSDASAVLKCTSDADEEFGIDVEDGPTKYGYQKAGCENAVVETFGTDHVTILRCGVLLGPHEYVGRLPWWLNRIARGGPVLAPGDPGRSIQPVDARDLADFTIASLDRRLPGTFNVVAPVDSASFGSLLEACVEVTGSDAALRWIPDDVLVSAGVRQWSEIPLWRTFAGVWQTDATKSTTAGLRCRPLATTVRDTWSWIQRDRPAAAPGIGLAFDKEARLLKACGRAGFARPAGPPSRSRGDTGAAVSVPPPQQPPSVPESTNPA